MSLDQFITDFVTAQARGVHLNEVRREIHQKENSLCCPLCGDCRHWMIARQCKREANGTFVHMNMQRCVDFEWKPHVKQWLEDELVKLRTKEAELSATSMSCTGECK